MRFFWSQIMNWKRSPNLMPLYNCSFRHSSNPFLNTSGYIVNFVRKIILDIRILKIHWIYHQKKKLKKFLAHHETQFKIRFIMKQTICVLITTIWFQTPWTNASTAETREYQTDSKLNVSSVWFDYIYVHWLHDPVVSPFRYLKSDSKSWYSRAESF